MFQIFQRRRHTVLLPPMSSYCCGRGKVSRVSALTDHSGESPSGNPLLVFVFPVSAKAIGRLRIRCFSEFAGASDDVSFCSGFGGLAVEFWDDVVWAVEFWEGVGWAVEFWEGVGWAVVVWAGVGWAVTFWDGVGWVVAFWEGVEFSSYFASFDKKRGVLSYFILGFTNKAIFNFQLYLLKWFECKKGCR